MGWSERENPMSSHEAGDRFWQQDDPRRRVRRVLYQTGADAAWTRNYEVH